MKTLIISLFLGLSTMASDASKKKEQIEKLFNKYQHKFSEVNNIEVFDVIALKNENKALLVDVRDKKEQNVSMIPGAITMDQFKKTDQSHKSDNVIFYCTIGVRSGMMAKKYQKKGFKTFNFKGSILSWAHAGMPFEKDGKETKKAHTYSKEWDFLPDGYQAVY